MSNTSIQDALTGAMTAEGARQHAAELARIHKGIPLSVEAAFGMSEMAIPRGAVETIEELASAVRTYVAENAGDPRSAEQANGRRSAHRQGDCYSPLNGRQPIFALVGYQDLQTLYGRLLTLVDASFADRDQRKAFKDMVRTVFWFNWVSKLDTDEPSQGAPADS